MMDIKSAWEKFRSTGKPMDYLNYRSLENGLLPPDYTQASENLRGTNYEIRRNRNDNKGKRS